jgi:hypothetical protein
MTTMHRSRGVRTVRAARLWRTRPGLEHLETRLAPSDSRLLMGPFADLRGSGEDFQAHIVAGDPNGSPADSPANRVDPNVPTSPYAGVGSIQVNAKRGTYIGTGTAIDEWHILTAAHVLDLNNDGKVNNKDGHNNVLFILNADGDWSHTISAAKITIHPDFTGFNKPSVNDDLAVIKLSQPLPAGIPIYQLPTSDLAAGTTITMVGYGQSGTGVDGYTVGASFTVKRTGENNADAFFTQDDGGRLAANEVFRFDFDGPTGNGTWGGATLGNDREATLGGGDSGGPSFVRQVVDGQEIDVIVGVNTFTQAFFGPYFGTLGGGINVYPYVSWIQAVVAGTDGGDGGGGNGGGKPGKGNGRGDATGGSIDANAMNVLSAVPPSVGIRGDATLVQDVAARLAVTMVEIAPPPAPRQASLTQIASASSAASPTRVQVVQQIGPLVGTQQERERLAIMEAPSSQRALRQAATPAPQVDRPEAEQALLALPVLEVVFTENADAWQDVDEGSAVSEVAAQPSLAGVGALTGFVIVLGGLRSPHGVPARQTGGPVASVRPKRLHA